MWWRSLELGLKKTMTKNEKMEQGRRWLALVRGSADGGSEGSKAQYLRDRGYTEAEVVELLEEDRRSSRQDGCGEV